jgi:acetyl esterase/lipase
MTSKNLIDPGLLKFFNNDPPAVDINAENVAQLHQIFVGQSKMFRDPNSENVKVTAQSITGPGENKLEVLIYRPENLKGGAPQPGILHMHGGGYVAGTAEMNEGFCKKMAKDIEAVVVSVDYRLATEAAFPGPLEDCYSALLWMSREHEALGIDTNRLAVTGESAGGGLAAQLAFLVRDRREVSIALQYLTHPMLDDRTAVANDVSPLLGEFAWTRGSNRFGWTTFLGQPAGLDKAPYPAVPARIENLQGLAPCHIVCGALDLLVIENLAYAQRLVSQGVPTEVHIYPGAFHGFMNATVTDLAKNYFEERRRVFQRAFATAHSCLQLPIAKDADYACRLVDDLWRPR